ncbi:hypothetical protein Asppvi_002018 [Aspergillus pseudoviridinutans]|uniref:Uncharacterized protein n=1 Tax=Aspergillus pseudoviridinutans TaxID=1517512 RepID=A0A9P3F1B9_9EURO|nr:uncharacterized protein Asppvi_002018 [Aspergillus pseudoviridinutans]GIJ92740.1 hypothetical protein Asppvi_002018 [Aspergillus pseudoviridinutans]
MVWPTIAVKRPLVLQTFSSSEKSPVLGRFSVQLSLLFMELVLGMCFYRRAALLKAIGGVEESASKTVEISGPDRSHLTIVDLPGCGHGGVAPQRMGCHSSTHNLPEGMRDQDDVRVLLVKVISSGVMLRKTKA